MKRILDILLKIIVWAAAVYLVLGFIIVPFAAKLLMESQGSKLLKHKVQVKTVSLNPIMLSLNIKGLAILDKDQTLMAGFDELKLDVSFLALLKKTIRIELVELNGPKANVTLLAGNKINLMDLVPSESASAKQASVPEKKDGQLKGKQDGQSVALPEVVLDLLAVKGGQVRFADQTVTPNFNTTVSGINVNVTGFSTNPSSQAKVYVQLWIDQKGLVSVDALLKPLAQPLELETAVTLNDYAMKVLSPYVGKYTGRALDDGKFEMRLDYRIANNKLTASHKFLIQKFTFGQKVESKDALPLPFGLALALLEDANGQIKVSLPATGDLSDPKFAYWPLIGQVIRDFFFKVVTKPFSFIGSMMGQQAGEDDLGYVRFLPGKSDIADSERAKITTLVKGLKERPKLRLEINGCFDPDMDWKVMKGEALQKEYEALKKESTGSEMKLYEMIYQRSFGIRDLWNTTKKYKMREGIYDEAKVVEDLKKQLIERAPADKVVMDALAQARARAVYDAFLAAGLSPQKVSLGQNRTVQASMGTVPLEFVLTVFDNGAEAAPAAGKTDCADCGM